MLVIPVQSVPSQTIQTNLTDQNVTLNIYQKTPCMFMDVYVGTTLIIAGVQCENLNRIVRDSYLGFQGDFAFRDTQGDTDPYYTGLGTRYRLLYLTPDDLASLGFTG